MTSTTDTLSVHFAERSTVSTSRSHACVHRAGCVQGRVGCVHRVRAWRGVRRAACGVRRAACGVWGGGGSCGTAGLHLLWGAEAVQTLGDDAAGLGTAEGRYRRDIGEI